MHSTLLQDLQYADDVEPAGLLNAHRQWNDQYARSLAPPIAPPLSFHQPLRIALVSENFSRHPIAFFVLPVLEALDRSQCSLSCYSDGSKHDEYTARFQAVASAWRDTRHLSNEEFAQEIKHDQIDVLVDLMGHVGRRLLVFARKPAPLQITWCGYASTTGLTAIDFLLADRFHIREGEEANYSESILRLPHDQICYQPPATIPAVSSLPALRQGQITFGCFNAPHKYSRAILDAWSRILQRVPKSRLILKYRGLEHADLNQRLRREFDSRGIAGERLLIEDESPQLEFLATYNRIDLALDTQPYSGSVTTCEALCMGVPVITCPGKTFAGRQSVSHLANAGYPQFIAPDLDAYIDLAVSWTNRLDELAMLRAQMRDQVRQSPPLRRPPLRPRFLNRLSASLALAPPRLNPSLPPRFAPCLCATRTEKSSFPLNQMDLTCPIRFIQFLRPRSRSQVAVETHCCEGPALPNDRCRSNRW